MHILMQDDDGENNANLLHQKFVVLRHTNFDEEVNMLMIGWNI